MKKKKEQYKPIAKPYIYMSDEELEAEAPNPLLSDLRGLVQAYRSIDKLYSLMTVEQLRTAYMSSESEAERNLICYWGKKKTGKL